MYIPGIINRTLYGARKIALHKDGVQWNDKHLKFTSFDNPPKFHKGLLTDCLFWNGAKYRFFRDKSLRSILERLAAASDAYWKKEYETSFENAVLLSDEFQRHVTSINQYVRDSGKHLIVDWVSKARGVLLDESGYAHFGLDVSRFSPLLLRLVADPEKFVAERNALWVSGQMEHYKPLFDGIEEHPLTDKQREACVYDEDNVLVVAGAGTGKTSAMRAKAAYLVRQGLAKPNEILMLAYGSDARKELEERVHEYDELDGVSISTFHALGLEIIGAYEEKRTDVSPLATDSRLYTKFVDEQIQQICSDPKFDNILSEYFFSYLYPQPNELEFKSHGEYLEFVKDNEIRDLAGNLVKSYEELKISNFLFKNGIRFQYEPRYEHDVSAPGKKEYRPDYYLLDFDLYIEHFGINKKGKTRRGIDSKKYNIEREWKIHVHKEHGTHLLQTFSWQSDEGLDVVLERELREFCKLNEIDFDANAKPRSAKALLCQLKEFGEYAIFSKLLSSYISLFKSSPYVIGSLPDAGGSLLDKARHKSFCHIFERIYEQYEQYLSSEGTLDFADMIRRAIKLVGEDDFHDRTNDKYRYRYIMVDEFQDISPLRANLVKVLRKQNSGCALFCVGDDWQAIYRFTGSDVSLTTDFSKHFGTTHSVYLDKTFRFNNRIEGVASMFVQKNKSQLAKSLITHSRSEHTEVMVLTGQRELMLEKALSDISAKGNTKKTVLVLSRFRRSLENVSGLTKRYPNLDIKCMSAHTSKGKQADYVVILDVNDGKYGFPSKVVTDPLLESLLPRAESYAYAEERRLFYVALTRAKNTVYIHTELGKESVFLKELKEKEYDVHFQGDELIRYVIDSARCPEYGAGTMIPKEGGRGLFYYCSLGRNYCDTTVDACPECGGAPVLRNSEKHYCASPDCDFEVRVCPACGVGQLLERVNSKTQQSFIGCSNFRGSKENSCRYSESVSKV